MLNIGHDLEALYQHINHINFHSFVNDVGKYFVNKPLIGYSNILQAEGHHLIIIKTSINN